jgi:hypothetical protein
MQVETENPIPRCKAHKLEIFKCEACSKILSQKSQTLGYHQLHSWAEIHLYESEPF